MNTLELRWKAHGESTDNTDYLVTELFIDGVSLVDFNYYATDLNELLKSTEVDGEFFILTCWCGIPLCAGIKHGIRVRHDKKTIYWQVTSPSPERNFQFDRSAYRQAVTNVLKRAKRSLAYREQLVGGRPFSITPSLNQKLFEVSRKQ